MEESLGEQDEGRVENVLKMGGLRV